MGEESHTVGTHKIWVKIPKGKIPTEEPAAEIKARTAPRLTHAWEKPFCSVAYDVRSGFIHLRKKDENTPGRESIFPIQLTNDKLQISFDDKAHSYRSECPPIPRG